MKFVAAIDLDGTYGDYDGGFRLLASRALGIDPQTLPPTTHWSYVKSGWPLRDEEHFVELHAYAVKRGLFRSMRPLPGASENMWKLSDSGVYIRILTHRLISKGLHRTVVTDTIENLETENVPYRDICFQSDKTQVDAHVYLDDAPHNIEALRAAGGYAIVFDQPYNQHVDGPRARDWDEARDLILARKEQLEADLGIKYDAC